MIVLVSLIVLLMETSCLPYSFRDAASLHLNSNFFPLVRQNSPRIGLRGYEHAHNRLKCHQPYGVRLISTSTDYSLRSCIKMPLLYACRTGRSMPRIIAIASVTVQI